MALGTTDCWRHAGNGQTSRDLIVDARAVRKVYLGGDVPVDALRGVDFAVRWGRWWPSWGPAGCGQDHPLELPFGIDSIDGGEIVIDGRPLQRMSDGALTRYRATSMGFVFQSFNLLPVLTAVENVEYPFAGGQRRAA